MLRRERLAVALQRGTEKDACELAYVPGPAVADQDREGVIADRKRPQSSLFGKTIEEVACEGGDVAAPVTERRQRDGRGGDALRKPPVEVVRQQMAAGGDHSHIDRVAPVETD